MARKTKRKSNNYNRPIDIKRMEEILNKDKSKDNDIESASNPFGAYVPSTHINSIPTENIVLDNELPDTVKTVIKKEDKKESSPFVLKYDYESAINFMLNTSTFYFKDICEILKTDNLTRESTLYPLHNLKKIFEEKYHKTFYPIPTRVRKGEDRMYKVKDLIPKKENSSPQWNKNKIVYTSYDPSLEVLYRDASPIRIKLVKKGLKKVYSTCKNDNHVSVYMKEDIAKFTETSSTSSGLTDTIKLFVYMAKRFYNMCIIAAESDNSRKHKYILYPPNVEVPEFVKTCNKAYTTEEESKPVIITQKEPVIKEQEVELVNDKTDKDDKAAKIDLLLNELQLDHFNDQELSSLKDENTQLKLENMKLKEEIEILKKKLQNAVAMLIEKM